MIKLETNKEYLLRLGEANPIKSFYLGLKRYKGDVYKHVFLICYPHNRSSTASSLYPRFYLGGINKTDLKEGIVHIKEPIFKNLKDDEKSILSRLISKLENQ